MEKGVDIGFECKNFNVPGKNVVRNCGGGGQVLSATDFRISTAPCHK